MKNSLGLSDLKPLFEKGGTTEAAARFFSEVHGTTLGTEYWGWVKNQAIEKKFRFHTSMGAECQIADDAVVGSVPDLEYPSADPEFSSSLRKDFLSPLAATVVPIKVTDEVGRTEITAGQPEGLAYKVYLKDETPCDQLDEGARIFPSLKPEVQPDGTKVANVYVVLANIQHQRDKRIEYTLEVKPAPPPP